MTVQPALALLITAFLFGGMLLYAGGFAAFLFTSLPAESAGRLLRRAFPLFYLWVIVTAALAAVLLLGVDTLAVGLLAAVAITAVGARQLLMPAINAATDAGRQRRFQRLHGLSVVLTLLHIAAAGWVLLRFL
jgi:hypothetical protein